MQLGGFLAWSMPAGIIYAATVTRTMLHLYYRGQNISLSVSKYDLDHLGDYFQRRLPTRGGGAPHGTFLIKGLKFTAPSPPTPPVS